MVQNWALIQLVLFIIKLILFVSSEIFSDHILIENLVCFKSLQIIQEHTISIAIMRNNKCRYIYNHILWKDKLYILTMKIINILFTFRLLFTVPVCKNTKDLIDLLIIVIIKWIKVSLLYNLGPSPLIYIISLNWLILQITIWFGYPLYFLLINVKNSWIHIYHPSFLKSSSLSI